MAHRGSRHAKKIDTVHWTFGAFTVQSLSAGVIGVNVASAQHLPETLLRIRGESVATFAGAVAPDQGVRLTVGLILVPEGTATTVLWSPLTDGDAPWIWWDVYHLSYTEMVTDVIAAQAAASVRRVIDSKAMRKIRNTELQFVAENTTMFSAASVDVTGAVRVLTGS